MLRLTRETALLRRGDADAVVREITALVTNGAEKWREDYRDLMLALPPLHWVASQVTGEAAAVFDLAAGAVPEEFYDLLVGFGRRSDITPRSFAFAVACSNARLASTRVAMSASLN